MVTHADQLRLLDLQALDTRIAQLKHAKANHPTLARIVELDSQLADLNVTLIDSRTAVSDLGREVRKAEDDVTTVLDRLRRNQERIDYGGLSAKDTQALMQDAETLERRRDLLETAQLESMERLEAHQAALTEVEAAYQVLEDTKSAVEAERDAAFAEINSEGREVITERKALEGTIDAGLVATYEQIRARKGGVGAAALRAGRCEGCGLELTAVDLDALRSTPLDAVGRCEECGRILVRLGDLSA
ncbi:MAG: C4-type zinc ribbon domain-containing protein [Promicromonosporaceae bacterium]|nr:C4-type zinc ribbon domain-containing protein [Promicromonosporaceae bacterium]